MISEREQREAARFHFTGTVHINTDQGRLETAVDAGNISLKGVFVATDKRLPLGTPCNLEIHISGPGSSMSFTVPGTVRRHEPEGLAIAFTDLDLGSRIHLQSLTGISDNGD